MSQLIFKNPYVSSAAALTGVGNGTVSIDKLTHFTVAQNYTLTCVEASPDCIFSVSGSLDGAVGLATAGTQFFDGDLKIFLTIQQGSTPFSVGDQFILSVANGTDVTQQNFDAYDEAPQKNFGAGLFGTTRGDHNMRYSNTAQKAYLYLQDLYFQAVSSGSGGDAISVEFAAAIVGAYASLINQDLTFTAATIGTGGNAITMRYVNYTPEVLAIAQFQGIKFTATTGSGANGNNINVTFTGGGTAGAEIVNVTSFDISVQLQSGVSTVNQVIAAIAAFPSAAALTVASVRGGHVGTETLTTQSQTFLTGGANAIGAAGFEVVSVVSNAITVTMQSGVSTATQIKAALDGSGAATALIGTTISGTGSNAQTFTSLSTPQSLSGGITPVGFSAPIAIVTSNAIKVYFKSDIDSATAIKSAVDVAASGLVTTTVIGNGASVQLAPVSAQNLTGGRNKFYALNHNEQSDSGNFAEGNASIHIKDALIDGKITANGSAHFTGKMSLKNANANDSSGNAVPDVQKYLNEVRTVTGVEIDGDITYSDKIAGPVANHFITDNDSLPKTAKKLDKELYDHEQLIGSDGVHGATPNATANEIASRDASGNTKFNKVVVGIGSSGTAGIDVPSAGDMEVGATVGANNLLLGAASSTVKIRGNLEVDGTTTTINSTILDVVDKNVTVNKGGTNLSSEGSGLTVDRVGTKGSLIYANAAATRFKIGDFGSEVEIADISTAQVLTNKTLAVGSNHITGSTAKVAQFNASTGDLEASGVTTTELGYVSGVTSAIQTQLNGKQTTALTSAHILVGNVSNLAADVAMTGDVTISNTGATTIANNAVTNAKAAQMAAHTFKGNNTVSTANALDLTATQLTAELNVVVGDTGSGGTKGLVPAPASGDAAAGKFLKADGTFAVPAGTGVSAASYRAGTQSLSLNDSSKAITFSSTLGGTGYRVVCQMVNTTDASVQFQPITITAKSATGFTAKWNAGVDSANYSIEYQAWLDN